MRVISSCEIVPGCPLRSCAIGRLITMEALRPSVVGSRPIGVHLSPCERQAGHPQGVALLYTGLHRRHERRVSRRATPCGWPAAALVNAYGVTPNGETGGIA